MTLEYPVKTEIEQEAVHEFKISQLNAYIGLLEN